MGVSLYVFIVRANSYITWKQRLFMLSLYMRKYFRRVLISHMMTKLASLKATDAYRAHRHMEKEMFMYWSIVLVDPSMIRLANSFWQWNICFQALTNATLLPKQIWVQMGENNWVSLHAQQSLKTKLRTFLHQHWNVKMNAKCPIYIWVLTWVKTELSCDYF